MANPTTPVYKSVAAADTHKTIYFTLAIAVNLLGIACLLIAWNAKGINNDNLLWAMLLVAIVAGSGILVCCLAIFFLCRPFQSNDNSKRRIFDVQTVYPTPEFQYFTNTMLNRVQNKLSSRGSDFSVVSTAPAGSPLGQNTDDSSMLDFANSPLPSNNNNPSNFISHSQQMTTCTGDSLELSLESAFAPSSRSSHSIDHSKRES
uniref:Uncharacterized protein n=1 Tax=Panagrolaimus sp. PS1159 TaxID=55785 RepID=A0AC35G789_9BILA